MRVRRLPAVVLLLGLSATGLSSSGITASAQAPPSPPPAQDPPIFRVGVDVIRVDAVVTDRDGRMVTDLTADDFELRQDGELQQIVAARYVSIDAPPAPDRRIPARTQGDDAVAPAPPAPAQVPASPSDVQRTIAIVVDDLGIAWENMEPTRRALRRFVDENVHEGDLVALVRTARSVSTLQQFTTDKRRLYSAIDQLQWNGFSRSGVTAFRPVNDSLPTGRFEFRGSDATDLGGLDNLRDSMSSAGTLGAVRLTMLGLRDLPGRKAVVLISEGFIIMEHGREGPGDVPYQPNDLISPQLERLMDYALRSGVVLYTLDPRGLSTGGLVAEDDLKFGNPGRRAGERRRFLHSTEETLRYMAEQTGGLAILTSNDIAQGLRRISDDQRGYYVLGYTPPEGTFARPGKTPRYHRISVKVRRPGVNVRTRRGFLGVSDEAFAPAPLTASQQLFRTAISPFAKAEIPLRVTVLPSYRPDEGAFVRALLHVEGRGLQFARNDAGRDVASIDVLGLVFDESGAAIAGRTAAFELGRATDAETGDGSGVVFSMTVPVTRVGGYQVRFAIRDVSSGHLGAAGQFVEIPDVEDGGFALSGLLVAPESAGAATVSSLTEGTPQGASASGPALRMFEPGTRLVYACEIYNAKAPVETRIAIWRDGRPFFTAPPVVLAPVDGARVVQAGGGLQLGERMPPGEYLLQLAARTPANGRGKARTAVQWVDFTVRPEIHE